MSGHDWKTVSWHVNHQHKFKSKAINNLSGGLIKVLEKQWRPKWMLHISHQGLHSFAKVKSIYRVREILLNLETITCEYKQWTIWSYWIKRQRKNSLVYAFPIFPFRNATKEGILKRTAYDCMKLYVEKVIFRKPQHFKNRVYLYIKYVGLFVMHFCCLWHVRRCNIVSGNICVVYRNINGLKHIFMDLKYICGLTNIFVD